MSHAIPSTVPSGHPSIPLPPVHQGPRSSQSLDRFQQRLKGKNGEVLKSLMFNPYYLQQCGWVCFKITGFCRCLTKTHHFQMGLGLD